MKIKSIRIDNFRGIGHLEIPLLDEHLNLFLGVNGAGKTSVFDAVSYVFSWYLARVKNPKSQGTTIPLNDIKNNQQDGCSISLTLDDGGSWTLFRNKPYKKAKADAGKTDLTEMMRYVAEVHDRALQGSGIPVVMFYPVDRVINSAPAHLKRNNRETEIWDAYENAIRGNAEFRSFFEWYRCQEDRENEHIRDDAAYRVRNLTAIRTAIGRFFPEFGNMRVRRNPQRFEITKGNEKIEFNQLSQGEKCYLALVCDLARRFAMANPAMQNPLEGSGVVMIDEIDLHLHPKWQMEITGKLRETFPNCQFLISTHSPHVVSDVQASQIFTLQDGMLQERAYNPYGRLAEEILSGFFDIPMARSIKVRDDIRKAYDALRNNDKEEFESIFKSLSDLLGRTDPEMVRLKLESVRRNRA